MFCGNCGREMIPGSKFCAYCGNKVDPKRYTDLTKSAPENRMEKPVRKQSSLDGQKQEPTPEQSSFISQPENPIPEQPGFEKDIKPSIPAQTGFDKAVETPIPEQTGFDKAVETPIPEQTGFDGFDKEVKPSIPEQISFENEVNSHVPEKGAGIAPPRKKQPKRSMLIAAIAGVLALVIFAGLLSTVLRSGKSGGRSGTMEGKGFNTPEEAVISYLEALKAGDMDAMRSCFAIETISQNYDICDNTDRIKVYVHDTAKFYAPTDVPLLQELNVERQRSRVSNIIYSHVLVRSFDKGVESGDKIITEFKDSYLVSNVDGDDMKKTMSIIEESASEFADLEIGHAIDPYLLSDIYTRTDNLAVIKKVHDTYGGSGAKCVAITLQIGGTDYLLSMDTIRYNDRWYLSGIGSNLAVIMGLDALSEGLIRFDDLDSGTLDLLDIMDDYSIYNYEDMKACKDSEKLEQFSNDCDILDMGLEEEEYNEALNGENSEEFEEFFEMLEVSSIQEVADYFAFPLLTDVEMMEKLRMFY